MDFEVTDITESDDGRLLRVAGQIGSDPWWTVTAVFEVEPGPPRLTDLHVGVMGGSAEPALTAEVLRSVPLAELAAEANRFLRFPTNLRQRPVPKPGGGDHTYAWWAARYMRHVDRGSRRPVADLAEEFDMTPTAARDLIHRCRAHGMLPKSRPGRAGGPLTAKARRLLGEEEVNDA